MNNCWGWSWQPTKASSASPSAADRNTLSLKCQIPSGKYQILYVKIMLPRLNRISKSANGQISKWANRQMGKSANWEIGKTPIANSLIPQFPHFSIL
jgi:hypothetical protein